MGETFSSNGYGPCEACSTCDGMIVAHCTLTEDIQCQSIQSCVRFFYILFFRAQRDENIFYLNRSQ